MRNLMFFQPSFRAWRWRGRSGHGLERRGIAFVPPQRLRLQLWQEGIQLRSTRLIHQRPLHGRRLLAWHLHFTQAWASLLASGVSQLDAIQLLATQAQHAQAHQWLQRLLAALHSGSSLAQGLTQSAAKFPATYCQLIHVGEQSGQLPAVLQRLSEQMVRAETQRKAVRKALTYPFIVLAVSICIALGMLYLIVPQFAALYEQMNVAVPASTQALLNVADYLGNPVNWLYALPLLFLPAVLRWLARRIAASPAILLKLYRVPRLGDYLAHLHLAVDLRTLHLAYASQLPITEACLLTARASSSAYLQRFWRQTAQQLNGGSSLYETAQQNPVLSDTHLKMIELGELSGRLTEQLDHIVRQLDERVEQSQQRILKALEPLFLALTGAMTGAILLALYVPLFQLGQLVG